MKATISKESITKALSLTGGIVEKKQTLPILSNILIEFKDNSFKLVATDLESELTIIGETDACETEGTTTASAKKLNDLCRLIPDKSNIELNLSGDKLNISTKNGKYSLATLPSNEFPIFESGDSLNSITLRSQDLKTLINSTSFAMGNQDWRHYLNGLFLKLEEGVLTAVATDAHRLALNCLDSVSDINFSGIIPRKSVNEINRFIGDDNSELSLAINDTSLVLSNDNLTFKSKLIDGAFPDYNQVIPTGDSSLLDVNVKDFVSSLGRVSILSNDKNKGVKIHLVDNNMFIRSNNADNEVAEETVESKYAGEEIEIAFNVNYIQEILNNQTNENCNVLFFGSDKSCLILPPGGEFPKYVVMPLLL
ncbi:DNA polymerase III subunit beta [SAR86 cluster bacterium]|jgi:DNA polymerase-3 subunit beta|nr:DNA polymerase III subunit beta [SAR86 cluster bacterium]|tara:strand:+ start:457 stop:1554 length:1098 start_codon:yes stop_codon:yes gene_type:complete